MAKVRFGERSGQYIQGVKMDSIVTKCDVCLKETDKNEKTYLKANIYSGSREDGPRPVHFEWKDVCKSCGAELVAMLKKFKDIKNA